MSRRTFALLLPFVLVLTVAPAAAQTTSGTLIGGVFNAKGAPIAEAKVSVINELTGSTRSTITASDGSYRVPFLPPGRYTIKVTMDGFQEGSVTSFPIPLNQSTNLVPPITLQPIGAAAGATTASAAAGESRASIINTNDATRRGNFDIRQVQGLPLSGIRSFDELALLVSGVSVPPATLSAVPGPGIGAGIGTSGQFSVNGQRARSNNFTVDGSDNNDPDVGVRRQGFVALVPQSIESIQEFQISTALWDAELGRNLGSQVNAVSRSGGASIHGQVYGFFSDSALNARDAFDLESSMVPAETAIVSATDLFPVFLDLPDGSTVPLVIPTPVGGENPFTRVQTGFVLGGPIVKQKTHYFLSFEYQHIANSLESHFSVPTVNERGLGGSGADGLLFFNRQTGAPVTGASPTSFPGDFVFAYYPFPNNPFGPYGQHTYTEVLPADGHAYVGSGKLDHDFRAFGKDHTVTARYNITADERFIPHVGGAIYSTVEADTETQNLSLILNSSLSPNLFNLFRASYGRTELDFHQRLHPTQHPSRFGEFLLNPSALVNATLPVLQPGPVLVPDIPHYRVILDEVERYVGPMGQIVITPYSPVGLDVYTFPQDRVSNTFQFADTMAWTWNKHSFKFGGDVRRVQLNSRQDRNFRPIATFAPSFNLQQILGYQTQFVVVNAVSGENAFDNVILSGADMAAVGAPANIFQTLATGTVADSTIGLRFTEWAFFIQDDIKLRPNFTLNLGLRYEYSTVPHEVNDRIENTFSDKAVDDIPDLATVLNGRSSIYESDASNWGPRVGFAWDPWSDGKTSIRGGYGIYYDAILGSVVSQSRNVIPTFLPIQLSFNTIAFPGLAFFSPQLVFAQPGTLNVLDPEKSFGSILATIFSGGGFAFTLPQPDVDTPYAQQYALTIEREIFGEYLVSAGYVGVQSRHLLRANMPNYGPYSTPVVTEILAVNPQFPQPVAEGLSRIPGPGGSRPFPFLGAFTWFETSGSSSYNALQLELEKRYSRNYALTVAYTWSHSIDDASDVFDLGAGSAFAQDVTRPDLERGNSAFDATHRFASSFIWDLPWFRDADGIEKVVFGDWRVANRVILQSGLPFTVNTVLDSNFDGLYTDRPATSSGISEHDDNLNQLSVGIDPLHYDAFGSAGYYDFSGPGAVGRNTYRAPGIATVDLAVSKTFIFTENTNLEFRTEVFNLFNRSHYGIPVRLLEAPSFGSAVSTALPSRQVQFALKLNF